MGSGHENKCTLGKLSRVVCMSQLRPGWGVRGGELLAAHDLHGPVRVFDRFLHCKALQLSSGCFTAVHPKLACKEGC